MVPGLGRIDIHLMPTKRQTWTPQKHAVDLEVSIRSLIWQAG